ncbi:MAG TPA: ribosome maturation factor RimP [Candidatus Binatia bacterium]|nr:ribosome maturation factor RimP [Candidatus Binatia bacterium]
MPDPDTAALADLLRPALEQTGVQLVEVQWRGGGRGSLLRLVVDRPGGVDLDDCERASTAASAILDAYDPIDVPYSLEVSSPGAERPIRTEEEWRAAVGRRVHVRFRSREGERVVEGRLVAAGGPTLEIEARAGKGRPQPVSVPADAVVAARIAVDI